MKKHNLMGKLLTATLAASMAISPAMAYAATTNDALSGTKGTDNASSEKNDLNDHDVIDKDATGKITIHKYDLTSAKNDGITFNWSDTDHDSGGTDSTMTTKDGTQIKITSNGKQNAEAEKALAQYAIKGNEFTYLRVGDVKTLSDINEDDINGDIELIYGVDTDLMAILGLKKYDAATKGTDGVAVTQVDGTNYFTAQQIRVALKNALEVGEYTGSYATGEGEGTGSANGAGNRLDNKKGVTVTDALEDYIQKDGAAHTKGTPMTETDATGTTSVDNLKLGLYLVVETKVPENVTETVNPWFVQIPTTTIEGTEWFYNIDCYPKNQTGHPTISKQVRNEYGTPGLNHNSDGTATYTTGDKVNKQDTLAPGRAGIVTNDDGKKGTDYSAWLTEGNKEKDYGWHDTTTASEGDVLGFKLESKLPNITSSSTYLKQYRFLDTLSEGLVYNNDAKIAIYNNKDYADVNDTTHAIAVWTKGDGANYQFECKTAKGKTNGANALDIYATDAGLDEINKKYYDGQHYLVVYYTATLDSSAKTVLGDEGNPNDVSLIWKRTSEGYYNTLEDKSIVYSYGIDLAKEFSDGNTKPEDFKAVKFVLYNETEDYYVTAKPAAEGKEGLYFVTGKSAAKTGATIFSPSSTGKLVVNGIEGDDYVLTEVETAKGYTLGQNQVKITINQASREITPSAVYHMTVAKDHDVEYSKDDKHLTLSDGTILDSKDEGTTDKDNMIVGPLTATTSTIDGVKSDMCKYGAQSIGGDLAGSTNVDVAKESANADVKMSITNHKGFSLPKTGDKGVYAVTIIGIIGAVVGFYIVSENRKKKAKAN